MKSKSPTRRPRRPRNTLVAFMIPTPVMTQGRRKLGPIGRKSEIEHSLWAKAKELLLEWIETP